MNSPASTKPTPRRSATCGIARAELDALSPSRRRTSRRTRASLASGGGATIRIAGALARRRRRLVARDVDQALHAAGDVADGSAEPRLHVVAAERDNEEVERRVAAQARRQIVERRAGRVRSGLRTRWCGRCSPSSIDVVVGAEFALHHAGPANVARQIAPRSRDRSPRCWNRRSRRWSTSRPPSDARACKSRGRIRQAATSPQKIVDKFDRIIDQRCLGLRSCPRRRSGIAMPARSPSRSRPRASNAFD